MSREQTFMAAAETISPDDVHRLKIAKAIGNYNVAVEGRKASQFRDWQKARDRAAAVKQHAIAHLPALLEQFEARFTAGGGKVLWAADTAEAQRHILDLVQQHGGRRVIKSKSMISEEIGLNELLEGEGMEVLESDLGELIVQLGGEKPYHIVTPAMHKSKDEIDALFHAKLGTPRGSSAEALTMAARAHLRDGYVNADFGFTGANFMIAEEGAIVLTENEGNGRLTMACPPVHVAIVGLEKMLPRLEDLALFLPLLATSGTGQEVTCYNSVIRGPRQPDEVDGPDHMIVIIVDNGRSELYQRPAVRESMRCIRCGACLNACPVYRTVGGHTYGTVYQGPIGSVITPHLRRMAEWQHLPQASSLCGACSDACPVSIDLHRMLLQNRWQADQEKANSRMWRWAMRGWCSGMLSRRRLNLARRLFRWCRPWLPLPGKLARNLPELAPKSFAELSQERADQEGQP